MAFKFEKKKDFGEDDVILRFLKNDEGIKLSQSRYIERTLRIRSFLCCTCEYTLGL